MKETVTVVQGAQVKNVWGTGGTAPHILEFGNIEMGSHLHVPAGLDALEREQLLQAGN